MPDITNTPDAGLPAYLTEMRDALAQQLGQAGAHALLQQLADSAKPKPSRGRKQSDPALVSTLLGLWFSELRTTEDDARQNLIDYVEGRRGETEARRKQASDAALRRAVHRYVRQRVSLTGEAARQQEKRLTAMIRHHVRRQRERPDVSKVFELAMLAEEAERNSG